MLVPRQQIAFASNAFLVEALDSLVVSDACIPSNLGTLLRGFLRRRVNRQIVLGPFELPGIISLAAMICDLWKPHKRVITLLQ